VTAIDMENLVLMVADLCWIDRGRALNITAIVGTLALRFDLPDVEAIESAVLGLICVEPDGIMATYGPDAVAAIEDWAGPRGIETMAVLRAWSPDAVPTPLFVRSPASEGSN
jgi:hypothetical protein